MIFGKEIKGRKIKFINLISKFVNGKAKRHIHIATYKHATLHLITVHSAIPKKKNQPKQNHQTLHTSRKPNIKIIKKKKKKKRGTMGFRHVLKANKKRKKKIEDKVN